MINTKVILKSRPKRLIENNNFDIVTEPLADLQPNEVLVQIEAISLDPAMRGWMDEGTTYIKGVSIGAVMRSFSAGKVIRSKNDMFKEGEYVSGLLGAQQYSISNGENLTKLNISKGKVSLHLGILGMPGMTAYFGLLEKGTPKKEDVIYISGAAGIVGSTVGQIAKIKGCTVIGSAGSDEKCQYLLNECGFDKVINYKTEDIDEKLKEYAPEGIHIYYDNVGGPTLDIALANLAKGARVVICGAISQYNNMNNIYGPKNYMKIVTARGHLTGIIVFDYAEDWPNAINEISNWINEKKIFAKEHLIHGLEKFPESLKMLYTGENFGKLVLMV
ncbi:NADP-dependent oxidoreductase [Aquimarina sp. RZ0]|uniref:NADP-dependent oxidoreductase n=1 Tax=Aquimarina sp. RZ0 TaxID=2607730 RepID=UPI0011F1921D|nr:NADP-dependent oxidoreductase [Aquimarina sp. RZ0]KAA1244950.1 NADP-dependent oxidoreductase [Aquimarina sp. RZ0]